MTNQVVSRLLEIIDQREPTEEEAQGLPAVIADDGGVWDRIPISQNQVDVLKKKQLIYYCGHCTKSAIECGENEDGSDNTYAAREYHTKEALCNVNNPEAYMNEIIAASKEK